MTEPRPVVVTPHALQQFRSRYLPDGTDALVRRQIEDEVRLAFFEGRTLNHKPDGFVLYREKRKQLPRGQRCVWSADRHRAWIIVRDINADVVVTSLSHAGVKR